AFHALDDPLGHEIIEDWPAHQRLQPGPHQHIRLEPLRALFFCKPHRMQCIHRYLILGIGNETDLLVSVFALDRHCNSDQRSILNLDAALLNWGDEVVPPVLIMPEDRGKQLDQRLSPYGRIHVKPCTIGSDSHADVTAEGRVPEMNRRYAFAMVLRLLQSAQGIARIAW